MAAIGRNIHEAPKRLRGYRVSTKRTIGKNAKSIAKLVAFDRGANDDHVVGAVARIARATNTRRHAGTTRLPFAQRDLRIPS